MNRAQWVGMGMPEQCSFQKETLGCSSVIGFVLSMHESSPKEVGGGARGGEGGKEEEERALKLREGRNLTFHSQTASESGFPGLVP